MAYIDETYYKAVAGQAAPLEFNRLMELTEVLFSRFGVPEDISQLPERAQRHIKMAAAEQILFLDANDSLDSARTDGTDVASATIGRFSYTASTSGLPQVSGLTVAPLAAFYLEHLGYKTTGFRRVDLW